MWDVNTRMVACIPAFHIYEWWGPTQEWRGEYSGGRRDNRGAILSERRGSRRVHIYEAGEKPYMKDHRLFRELYMGIYKMILVEC